MVSKKKINWLFFLILYPIVFISNKTVRRLHLSIIYNFIKKNLSITIFIFFSIPFFIFMLSYDENKTKPVFIESHLNSQSVPNYISKEDYDGLNKPVNNKTDILNIENDIKNFINEQKNKN